MKVELPPVGEQSVTRRAEHPCCHILPFGLFHRFPRLLTRTKSVLTREEEEEEEEEVHSGLTELQPDHG